MSLVRPIAAGPSSPGGAQPRPALRDIGVHLDAGYDLADTITTIRNLIRQAWTTCPWTWLSALGAGAATKAVLTSGVTPKRPLPGSGRRWR